jgi:hypothetical protein
MKRLAILAAVCLAGLGGCAWDDELPSTTTRTDSHSDGVYTRTLHGGGGSETRTWTQQPDGAYRHSGR